MIRILIVAAFAVVLAACSAGTSKVDPARNSESGTNAGESAGL